jgi:hypothetical protein
MNKDFRISIAMPTHIKTIKLMRKLGDRSFFNLVKLWAYTALIKPDGILAGMDSDDIEIAADWNGENGIFTETLAVLKFIDKDISGCFSIHDWDDHNEYAAGAEQRSEKARKAANTRHDKTKQQTREPEKEANEQGKDAKPCYEQCPKHDVAMPSSLLLSSLLLSTLPETKTTTCSKPEKASDLKLSDSQIEISKSGLFDCQQKTQPDITSPTQEAQPPVIEIPLVCKKTGPLVEFGVTQAMVDDWAESYPGVDIMQSLREIRQWNLANPIKRKTKSGIMHHITSWLAKAQNNGGSTRQMSPTTKPEFRVISGMPVRTVNNINAASAFLERQENEKTG